MTFFVGEYYNKIKTLAVIVVEEGFYDVQKKTNVVFFYVDDSVILQERKSESCEKTFSRIFGIKCQNLLQPPLADS